MMYPVNSQGYALPYTPPLKKRGVDELGKS